MLIKNQNNKTACKQKCPNLAQHGGTFSQHLGDKEGQAGLWSVIGHPGMYTEILPQANPCKQTQTKNKTKNP